MNSGFPNPGSAVRIRTPRGRTPLPQAGDWDRIWHAPVGDRKQWAGLAGPYHAGSPPESGRSRCNRKDTVRAAGLWRAEPCSEE